MGQRKGHQTSPSGPIGGVKDIPLLDCSHICKNAAAQMIKNSARSASRAFRKSGMLPHEQRSRKRHKARACKAGLHASLKDSCVAIAFYIDTPGARGAPGESGCPRAVRACLRPGVA